MTRKAPEPKPWLIGEFSPSKRGTVKHYSPPPLYLATPTRVTNSMSRDPLDLRAIWTAPVRQGADHSRFPSKGQGC